MIVSNHPDNDWPYIIGKPIPLKEGMYAQFIYPASLEEIVDALECGKLKLANLSKRTRRALEEAAK